MTPELARFMELATAYQRARDNRDTLTTPSAKYVKTNAAAAQLADYAVDYLDTLKLKIRDGES